MSLPAILTSDSGSAALGKINTAFAATDANTAAVSNLSTNVTAAFTQLTAYGVTINTLVAENTGTSQSITTLSANVTAAFTQLTAYGATINTLVAETNNLSQSIDTLSSSVTSGFVEQTNTGATVLDLVASTTQTNNVLSATNAEVAALATAVSLIPLQTFVTEFPGVSPSLFTTSLAGGDPSLLPLVPNALIVQADEGAAIRLVGNSLLAIRALLPVAPGATYLVQAAVQRRVDTPDPANDAVRVAIAWYDQAQQPIGGAPFTVVQDFDNLFVASGRQTAQAVIARAAGVGVALVVPAGARFARPYIQTWGTITADDVQSVAWGDISNVAAYSPDLTSLTGRIGAVESLTLGPRVSTIESEITSPNAMRFSTISDAQAATIGVTTLIAEVQGYFTAGDGGAHFRVRGAGPGALIFSDGSSWVPAVPGRKVDAIVFGAKYDGVTDNRVAVEAAQKALGSGGEVVISGRCRVSLLNSGVKASVLSSPFGNPANAGGHNTIIDFTSPPALLLDATEINTTTGTTVLGNPAFTVASASGIVVGMLADSVAIQGGDTVTAISGSQVTVGAGLRGTAGAAVTTTAQTINGLSILTLGSVAGILEGATVACAGVPSGTTVIDIGDRSGQVYLSTNATATTAANSPVSVTFTNPASIAVTFSGAVMLAAGCGARNLLTLNKNVSLPAATAGSYGGTAFRAAYLSDDTFIDDCLVVGFRHAFRSRGASDGIFSNSRIRASLCCDAINGLEVCSTADSVSIPRFHNWPYGTVGSISGSSTSAQIAAALSRTGIGLRLAGPNDDTVIGADNLVFGHAVNFDFARTAGVNCMKLWSDANYVAGSGSIGFRFSQFCQNINIQTLIAYSTAIGIQKAGNALEMISIDQAQFSNLEFHAVSMSGGDLVISDMNVAGIGGAPFSITDSSARVRVKGRAVNTGLASLVYVPTGCYADQFEIDMESDLPPGASILGGSLVPWRPIASAGGIIAMPAYGERFTLSNGADVYSITGRDGVTGQLTLRTGAVTVFHNGNDLFLKGGVDVTAPANAIIQFLYEGSTLLWFETSRSF